MRELNVPALPLISVAGVLAGVLIAYGSIPELADHTPDLVFTGMLCMAVLGAVTIVRLMQIKQPPPDGKLGSLRWLLTFLMLVCGAAASGLGLEFVEGVTADPLSPLWGNIDLFVLMSTVAFFSSGALLVDLEGRMRHVLFALWWTLAIALPWGVVAVLLR